VAAATPRLLGPRFRGGNEKRGREGSLLVFPAKARRIFGWPLLQAERYNRAGLGNRAAIMTCPYQPAVYLLASRRNGTLYTGVTSNLVQRVWQHRNGVIAGFTARYQVNQLVWYEFHTEMTVAIGRELAIKRWRRSWKLQLIERFNPGWRDLWAEISRDSV